MDWGKYREALEYGHHQLGISEELDSRFKMEAYLNLSRAHERLGLLERALSYARHSLYNECDTQCRTGGLVHLTVAGIYLEMGGFSRALESLQGAHKIGKFCSFILFKIFFYPFFIFFICQNSHWRSNIRASSLCIAV
jgi:tetratricopeptide (TPR) repeat protein